MTDRRGKLFSRYGNYARVVCVVCVCAWCAYGVCVCVCVRVERVCVVRAEWVGGGVGNMGINFQPSIYSDLCGI